MAPHALPQRNSLVAQTVAFLRAQIESGEWSEWLPNERMLSQHLQVSRNTLRSALVQLRGEEVIRSVHGSGNMILGQPRRGVAPVPSRDVALLTPNPVERLLPIQTLWIDEMRALLTERGIRLHVFHGHQYFTANPGSALKRLVNRYVHGCWILMLAGESVQRWFSQNRIPCVVAGSTYPELALPFSDRDHRAMCRHAVGILRGLGHQRIAMLAPQPSLAGDLESEAGFIEGAKSSPHHPVDAIVVRHEANVAGVSQALKRLLERKPGPTALLIINSYAYLTVAGRLAQFGVRIPQDISLIARDADPFLSFVVPEPAHYVVHPHLMAKKLLRPALELLNGVSVTRRSFQIIPRFVRGESVAAPPGG